MMKPFYLTLTALALRPVDAYLVSPPGTAAPGANEDCSGWVYNAYKLSCDAVVNYYGITLGEFEEWNPLVNATGSGCSMIAGLYYCVQINYISASTSSTSASTSVPTSTSSTTATTTSSGNGITTPTPTQTGMVGNCDDFYFVASGDSCYDIAANTSISLDDFYDWNPAVGSDCASLWPDYYVCICIGGSATTTLVTSTTTTTTSDNGITTPTPTQSGMVSDCDDFYLVVSGDSCYDIAADAGISLDDFYDWNPAVGSDCASLWPDYYVCTGISGTATTTVATTTTATGNGVITPTPTQAGMVSDCGDFYLVVSGDGCYDIAANAGISLDDFYAWNPAVGSDCASLWPDYYVCVGIL